VHQFEEEARTFGSRGRTSFRSTGGRHIADRATDVPISSRSPIPINGPGLADLVEELASGHRPTPKGCVAEHSAGEGPIAPLRRLPRTGSRRRPRPTGNARRAGVKTGVVAGAVATNPATGAWIPVFVADYVLPASSEQHRRCRHNLALVLGAS
jgi:hypothetical protein